MRGNVMEKKISKDEAKNIIANTNGGIFGATFIKKDNTVRRMRCRLAVKKYLKGGENTTKHMPHYLNVFEMKSVAGSWYRKINLETLLGISFNGVKYIIN
jgi:hypothetical protein